MSRTHHHRFFVPPADIGDGFVRFSPAQAHQIGRVLRLRPGDAVQVFDGTGCELRAALLSAAAARVLEATRRPPPPLRISLAQVVPRGARMDLIVAKATELGASRIQPLESAHSVRRAAERMARWQRIAVEAAEQSGRVHVPDLARPCDLNNFLERHPADEPLILCHAGGEAPPLAALCGALAGAGALSLLVGSEGGFGAEELARCRDAGARPAWLGPRLLRAETAALAALAVIQAALGDWRREGVPCTAARAAEEGRESPPGVS
jgi:16S rRNA (uracil1498-N3)-methyltransferase